MKIDTITEVTIKKGGIKAITSYFGDVPNTPPYISDVQITIDYNETHTFSLSDFTSGFSDVDGDELYSIKILDIPSKGVLLFNNQPIAPGDVIYYDDIDLITYIPAVGGYGLQYSNFKYVANDDGIAPNLYSPYKKTVWFNVLENTPPVVSNKTISIAIDETYNFTASDFSVNYYDKEGDSLYEVKIISLPSKGTFLLDGVAVIQNQVIGVSDLDLLSYTPESGESGLMYAIINFAVRDNISIFGATKKIVFYVGLAPDPIDD